MSRGSSNGPVADAQQAADVVAHRVPQPPHLAIAPLVQHHAEGTVTAPLRGPSATMRSKRARTVLELPRPVEETRSIRDGPCRATRTRYSRSISLEGCMRRCASSPSVVSSSRPEVSLESADSDPSSLPGRRQPLEHGRAPLRIPSGRDLADRLVIKE